LQTFITTSFITTLYPALHQEKLPIEAGPSITIATII
jgi:hypothetical protein